MFGFLTTFGKAFRAKGNKQRQSARRERPQVEALEDRCLMAVTYHGGPVLKNVDVQGLYYGADWAKGLSQDHARLEGFLQTTVNSSYMDMLTNAGYGVGRGSFTPGYIDPANLPSSQFLTDAQIQKEIQADISNSR
jgi:hypothetical protein